MGMPNARAALALMTRCTVRVCSTGMSAGFAPLEHAIGVFG